jgi:hypothetical protein
VKLVRDSGRVLNGAPQFVGRPEGELQLQAVVGRVWPSRTSGFSACQVFVADLILERQSAALLPSFVDFLRPLVEAPCVRYGVKMHRCLKL